MAFPIFCLLGPTASGKSACALYLAQYLPVEIISVDSSQVYRRLDLGTAKPSAQERAICPHHLIDIREPDEPYSAAQFAADARRLLADIRARGKIPLLVGGTFLYVQALARPFDEMPEVSGKTRADIAKQGQEQGWPALHAQLQGIDPTVAQRISPNDSQRISRALEVFYSSGKPLSHYQRHYQQGRADENQTGKEEQEQQQRYSGDLPAPYHVLSLEPTNREELHQRIAARFDHMLAAGLLDEVAALRQNPRYHLGLPAFRAVGYRQLWQYLDAQETEMLGMLPDKTLPNGTPASPTSLEGLLGEQNSRGYAAHKSKIAELGTIATRQLAKRQLTWLRSIKNRTQFDCTYPQVAEQVLQQVLQQIKA